MKKNLVLILFGFIISSCNNQKNIISNEGIGNIKIGAPLDYENTNELIEIFFDDKKNVKTIIVYDEKLKTTQGFGVGSNINAIGKKLNSQINKKSTASKGQIPIMDLGKSVFYKNIIFIDSNKDNIVDEVIINDMND